MRDRGSPLVWLKETAAPAQFCEASWPAEDLTEP
jgi:hypothetical protein